MDDLYEFPDSWIELYNETDSDIDINGWYISGKKNYEKGWKISGEAIIPGKGYLLIYCDKVGKGLHTDFRLETTKESDLYLYDKYGRLIDRITDIPAQPQPNISAGRDENGEVVFFITSTPGEPNSELTAKETAPSPIFSINGGVYKENITLELSIPENIRNARIYYTLDSSEPDINSEIYTMPLEINSTTVVKAKIIADNYLIPWSTTNSYIISERDFTLPVISLSLDEKFLFDNMIGIYTSGINGITGCAEIPEFANYRQNWRRPVNFEYFPEQNSPSVINQLAETRIMGNCSREAPIKSMAIYSHKRFGKKHFSYPIFQNEDKKNVIIKSMMLRNSGNDWEFTYFQDAFIQSLMAGKVDLEYQAYQPTVLYINGEYWGMINIRERSNEDHVYGNYEELENIDMIESWGGIKAGDREKFDFLMNGLANNSFSYEELEKIVDIQELINLFVIQVFVANGDFPFNNFVMWRKRTDNSKWRFIIKDTDLSLLANENERHYNTMNFYFKEIENEYATRLIRKLMSHKEFSKRFLDCFTVYMGDFLCKKEVFHVMDSLIQNIQEEIPFYFDKYNILQEWEYRIGVRKKWLSNRYENQYKHLNDFYGLNGTVKLDIERIVSAEKPVIEMNDIQLLTHSFDGMYYKGRDLKIRWTGNSKSIEGWKVDITYEQENKPASSSIYESQEILLSPPMDAKSIKVEAILNELPIHEENAGEIFIRRTHAGFELYNLELYSNIRVYDMGGKIIHNAHALFSTVTIPIPTRGIYIIHIANKNNRVIKKAIY